LTSAVSYVMKVSGNGQVSIPAETRARWNVTRVTVVDLGDRVVMRPLPDEPVKALRGKYAGRGPDTDTARRAARVQEAAVERRRRRA
jgi:bifunctional DNA-binding transcriptional regulator/antitoxin component of YhaV-PrlF toxin-antitoxin module